MSSSSRRHSHGRDDEDEKEDANLLRGYKREDEHSKEMLVEERYMTNETGGTSRQAITNCFDDFPLQMTQWMDDASNRFREMPFSNIQQSLFSVPSPGAWTQIQRRCVAAIGSFLVFLKPSFIQLWTNDKPQKLHSTAYLDGLRGVASLFVVFHHYVCQFIPALLEGWGTEHDNYWLFQFPIIRVTHNGALMVEIFFVLSGFVLSVKSLRLARQGRQQEFVRSLTSSAFRRWLRLAIPVFSSLLMALFITRAQLYSTLPPDWLNAGGSGKTSKPSTQRIQWLASPAWMAPKDPSIWNQLKSFFPVVAYILNPFNTSGVQSGGPSPTYDSGVLWTIPIEWTGSMITFILVLGLGWAKPLPKLICLIAFASWGYHLGRGNLAQFVSGIILAELKVARDAWEQGRAELPEFDAANIQANNPFDLINNFIVRYLGRWRHLAVTTFWSTIFLIGLFLGSFPYAKGDKSIGWSTITSVMKNNEIDFNSSNLFYVASILIVISIINCVSLQRIFNTPIAQYLGRISFSLYLLHIQLMWTLGTRLFPFCMYIVGGGDTSQIRYTIGMLLAGAVIFPLQFWISDVFCRAADEKSIVFTKWVANNMLDFGGRD